MKVYADLSRALRDGFEVYDRRPRGYTAGVYLLRRKGCAGLELALDDGASSGGVR